LADVNKLLLLSVSYWCILVILEGAVLKPTSGPVRVIVSLTGCPDLQEVVEPLVRCLKLGWQLAGVDLEIAVDARGCSHQCVAVVRKLVDDGVIASHLSAEADFVINPSSCVGPTQP
jgi:hypothetical protein